MHLIFYWRILLGSAPKSGQGFSIWPFPFALEAIEFQKFHLNFLKKRAEPNIVFKHLK